MKKIVLVTFAVLSGIAFAGEQVATPAKTVEAKTVAVQTKKEKEVTKVKPAVTVAKTEVKKESVPSKK